METTAKYWIQEQTATGHWFDSVGLPSTKLESAQHELSEWQRAFPERKSRLALITTVPLN